MSITKKPEGPSLTNNSWLSDFFDSRFSESDLVRNQALPAVNVRETDKSFEIELAVPGLNKRDFNVTSDNGVLTISCEREEGREQKDNGFTRKEFGYSAFSRSFTLPENVNKEEIKAKYEDGILKLLVSKKDAASVKPGKAIEVK